MSRYIQVILIFSIGVIISGCAKNSYVSSSVEERAKHQSPNNFYNAGMLRCSLNDTSFDDICDYAIYKEKKSPIRVVIEDIAIATQIKYRVLYFINGKFKSKNKKDKIHFHKTASNHYQINIGRENYLLPIKALSYQPETKEETKNNNIKETPLKEYQIPKQETTGDNISKNIQKPIVKEEPKVEEPKVIVTPIKTPTPKKHSRGTKKIFKR